MKNQASETTSRRRRDMRGIIPLARPGGESAFAFRPSAAEKSEQRSSLRYGLTAWLVVQNSGVPGLAGGMLCAWNHRTPRLRLGGLSIWVRLRAAESQTRRLALPCCMGRMPKPQAAWHGHPAREGVMAGAAIAKPCGGQTCPHPSMARMAMPRPSWPGWPYHGLAAP